jgi:thioredoxin-like negative regulator of GroEL
MNGSVEEINATEWLSILDKQKRPLMVMFYNPTCPHCTIMEPSFIKHAEQFKDKVTFMKFNIQQNQQIPYSYGIQSTPTFIFFCHNQPITMLSGAVHPSILKHAIENGLLHGEDCAMNRTPIDYEFYGYV